MKKTLLTIILAASCIIGYAQGDRRGDPAQMAERQTERLTKELSLTDEQKAKVKMLYTERAKENKEIPKDDSTKRKELTAKFRNDLASVLTPEQLTKFKAFKEERKNRRGGRKSGGKEE